MTWKPETSRNIQLIRGVDPLTQRGLEIGALNNPIVPPTLGNMTFVDYTDTAGLKHQHAALPDRVAGIINVNYVWSGSGSLADVIGERDVFDFVIASHVIEHVPNTLGWFRGIAEVMKPGAVFNLAIPDKRYTFDINCPLSTAGQLIEADLYNYIRPSVRQMFDHTWNIAKIDPGEIWEKDVDIAKLEKFNGEYALYLAHDQANRIRHENSYFDSHCWIYTPASFLDLLEVGILLERFNLLPINLETTMKGQFEFFFSAQKPTEPMSSETLKMKQFDMLQHLKRTVAEYQRLASLTALEN